MRDLKVGVSAMILALVIGAPLTANAADYPEAPPPDFRPAVFDWNGAYGGFQVGYGVFDTEYLPIPGYDPNLTGRGILGGGLLGYNVENGGFLYGVEGDIFISNMNGSHGGHRFEIENGATLRGRAGYIHGETLYYLTAGVSGVEMDIKSSTFGGDDEEYLWGLVGGGGVEWHVDGGLTMRAEYLFGWYDDATFNLTGGQIKAGLDQVHMVRAALIWNMNYDR